MRLTIVLLGHTLDLSLEPTEAEDTEACSLDGGTLASDRVPVGFTDLMETGSIRWAEPEE